MLFSLTLPLLLSFYKSTAFITYSDSSVTEQEAERFPCVKTKLQHMKPKGLHAFGTLDQLNLRTDRKEYRIGQIAQS